MQHGSLALVSRREGPAVWRFRWSEKDLHGARVQRKKLIGTVERYLDEAGAVLLSQSCWQKSIPFWGLAPGSADRRRSDRCLDGLGYSARKG